MKIFQICSFYLTLTAGYTSRNRRSASISLTGDESLEKLDSILATVANGTVDEIEAEIMASMGLGLGRRDPVGTALQERKFRNLKILVIWLQKGGKFGRYCYYGCHCLPEGSHDLANGGYGKPMDNIDHACRRFGQCYKCLVEEHKDDKFNINGVTDCKGEEIGYQADLIINDQTGEKSIECLNKLGSCRRNICECDKQLAENLAKYEDEWNEANHSRKGGFDREKQCTMQVRGSNTPRFEECCGDRKTFPFNEPRTSAQCCEGPEARQNGQCSL